MEQLWEAALTATGATGEQLLLALSVVAITLLFVVLRVKVRPPCAAQARRRDQSVISRLASYRFC